MERNFGPSNFYSILVGYMKVALDWQTTQRILSYVPER